MEMSSIHFDHELPLGDFTVLPPELLEKIMSNMDPLSLLPLIMSCSMIYALAHNDRIWDKVYKRTMPQSHKALHLAPIPDFWKFRFASSIKFVFEYAKLKSTIASHDDFNEVDTVMKVMKEHRSSVLVQRAAVYILRRLAYYPPGCGKDYRATIEVFRANLGREGGIKALLNAVCNFEEPEIVSGALCAIGNLVIDGDNAEALLELKGIETIIAAINRHLGNFSVVDYGCFALCNMGDDFKYKEAIYNAKAADVALRTLTNNHFRPEEMTPPLDLLAVLCNVPECKKEHGRKIIEVVNSLLPLAMENSKLFAHILTVAVLVCENLDENRDFAVECSFVQKMFEALDKYSTDAHIVVKSCLVLFTLFWRNDAPNMAEYRLRLVKSIISAMTSFKGDRNLQRTSAAMLSDFAHSDSALKSLIISLGGKQLVRAAIAASRPEDDNDPEWTALSAFISIED
jgi:hypothetical protein